MDRFQDVSRQCSCYCREGLIIAYSFIAYSVQKYDAVMFAIPAIPYLKVLFMACFQIILKPIIRKQLINLAPFSQGFSYFQNNHFVEYVQKVMLYVLYFLDKIKFSHRTQSTWLLQLFILISSAILLSKIKLLFLSNLPTSLNVNNLSINYREKYVRVYSLKRIPLI